MTTCFLPRKSERRTFLSFSRWLFSSKSGAISPTSGMVEFLLQTRSIGCCFCSPRLTRLQNPIKLFTYEHTNLHLHLFCQPSSAAVALCVKSLKAKISYAKLRKGEDNPT